MILMNDQLIQIPRTPFVSIQEFSNVTVSICLILNRNINIVTESRSLDDKRIVYFFETEAF